MLIDEPQTFPFALRQQLDGMLARGRSHGHFVAS
jgi:hypothetical protein